ncbi:MAG: HEAT repeat domain-containing protein [Bacteroidia bacterium]
MFRKLCLILTCLCTTGIPAQTLEDFKKEFASVPDGKFTEDELNAMFTNYTFLTPSSDITRLAAGIKGEQLEQYPMQSFRNDPLYKAHISRMLSSSNPNKRILAYLLVASTGDKTMEDRLLVRLQKEKNKGGLIWCGMSLMYLNTAHTTALFDFLVEHEEFGDAHMLPLYILLNKDSLMQTAYKRIDSKKPMARILAAQILAYTPLNSFTETLLKKAVREWDINVKGYAIYSVKELKIGHLLETFKPLLDSAQTRKIALGALANSPTPEDQAYLHTLVSKQDTVSEELLDAFFDTKQLSNIRYWLKLLYAKPLPKEYRFFLMRHPLIVSDSILPDLFLALKHVRKPDLLSELIRALRSRSDSESTSVMVSFLSDTNSTVRYWAGHSLEENHSHLLCSRIPDLIRNPQTRTTALIPLAIENKIDSLQTLFESVYASTSGKEEWRSSSVQYLAAFPRERHKDLFRKILEGADEDTFIKREAATGLGKLKDANSVDLIIAVSRKEGEASDYNTMYFLMALADIKGDKARGEIEKYKNSKEEVVRNLVEELLKKW